MRDWGLAQARIRQQIQESSACTLLHPPRDSHTASGSSRDIRDVGVEVIRTLAGVEQDDCLDQFARRNGFSCATVLARRLATICTVENHGS